MSDEKPAEQPDDNETLVRVYNQSAKQYTHEVYKDDARGFPAAKYISAPKAFITVPAWLAKKWCGWFPGDLLPGDDALRAIDSSAADLAESKEKVAALEEQRAALAVEVEKLKAQLASGRPVDNTPDAMKAAQAKADAALEEERAAGGGQ